ncbi:DMT family transporter [Desmospora profundinema]|uniref:Drug/metabolite transporter (DMT)-like permease n=1 Tax=Desmospora profundinema TaxID=1571184 RepID=A0ABU1IUF9_9BACL|nr:DMT family transporter [Desmospora profundinema]MDR6227549.1 drug/metabolite transporter (DMT)-like permease [Desmospora profundinema]
MARNHAGLYFLMTFNMMVWGLNAVALKWLVLYFPPLPMQGIRLFLAGLALLPLMLVKGSWKPLSSKEWGWTAGIILTGVVGHHSLLAWGLTLTTATSAVLILALLPLMTSSLACLFLREKITGTGLCGILLGLAGVILVVFRGDDYSSTSGWGNLLIAGCMLSQAVSFILIKKATDTIDTKQLTSLMFLAGSVLIFLIGLFVSPDGISIMANGPLWVWAVLILSGVVASGWGHMMYNSAIHKLGPGQTALFNNLTPFFALVGSALLLGETIQWTQAAGFLLIVSGVFLGTGVWRTRRDSRMETPSGETGIGSLPLNHGEMTKEKQSHP